MNRGSVGGPRHQSVENVELADQMTLADAADRRIARHLTKIFGSEGQQPDARAAPRRGSSRFTTGMAGTDDQDVKH